MYFRGEGWCEQNFIAAQLIGNGYWSVCGETSSAGFWRGCQETSSGEWSLQTMEVI